MQQIGLKCDLNKLSKYTGKVSSYIEYCNKHGLRSDNFLIEFELPDNLISIPQNLIKTFSRLLTKDFGNRVEEHIGNLFYLFFELYAEVVFNESRAQEFHEALECLEFLYVLLKNRESGKKLELVIRNRAHSPVDAIAQINSPHLVTSNLLDDMIQHIGNVRFINETLFNAIQPSDFESSKVSEIIKHLQPVKTSEPKFQIAYYLIILMDYIEVEITSKSSHKFATAKVYRLLFDLLTLFGLSDHIIPLKLLPSDKYLDERNALITNITKKLIENHRKSVNSDYHKIYLHTVSPKN